MQKRFSSKTYFHVKLFLFEQVTKMRELIHWPSGDVGDLRHHGKWHDNYDIDSRRTSVILSLRSFPVEGISKLKTTGKVVGARRKFICEKKGVWEETRNKFQQTLNGCNTKKIVFRLYICNDRNQEKIGFLSTILLIWER